jgi:hypothetical protein
MWLWHLHTGAVTIIRARRVSMLNEIEMAPIIIKKIVPGPRIEEVSMMNWYIMYLRK